MVCVFVKMYNEELIGALTYTFNVCSIHKAYFLLLVVGARFFVAAAASAYLLLYCCSSFTFCQVHAHAHEKLMITYVFFPLTP